MLSPAYDCPTYGFPLYSGVHVIHTVETILHSVDLDLFQKVWADDTWQDPLWPCHAAATAVAPVSPVIVRGNKGH